MLEYNLYMKISGSVKIFPYEIQDYVQQKEQETSEYSQVTYSFDNETLENLADANIYPVELTNSPSHGINQDAIEVTPTEKSGSVYLQKWEVYDLTQQEIEDSMPIWWDDVRVKRDKLFRETDYMANSDYPITDQWKSYRQALRDITNQNHPLEVNWPTKPE